MVYLCFFVSLFLAQVCANAWQLPSSSIWCGDVSKALSRKGIVVSVSIPNQPLLPGEIIEPKISFSNISDSEILVPEPDPTSQVTLDIHRRIDDADPLRVYHMHSINRVSPADSGDRYCRVKTRRLAPGTTFEFSKAQYKGMPLLSHDFVSQVPRADPRSGKHKFVIYIGDYEYTGFYDVHAAKLISYICLPLQRKGSERTEISRGKCAFVQALYAGDKYFLMIDTIAEETDIQKRKAKEADQLILAANSPNQNEGSSRSLFRGQRLRIASFDSAIEFSTVDRFPAVADPDQLQILRDGTRVALSNFLEELSARRSDYFQDKVTPVKRKN